MHLRVSLTLALLALAVTSPLRAQEPPSITQVAASLHILVLYSDGSVVALGENRSGQLARPKQIRRFMPAGRVPLPGKAVQLAAGEDTSFALLEDGTVWAWGAGFKRELGVAIQGTERETPAPVPGLRNVRSIHASGSMGMAILADGTVRAWGDLPKAVAGDHTDYPGVAPPIAVAGLEHVAALTGSGSLGFALTTDGRVFGWGNNSKGYLGLGTTGREPMPPTELPLKDVVSIAVGAGATAAVTRDGRVWTWGHNEQANLGNAPRTDPGDPGQPTPQPVAGLTDAVDVKTGTYGRHIIVRRRNNTLIGWGNSDWGQLGAGVSGDDQPKPTPIKLPDVEAYWLGGNFSFARTMDASLWFWGEESGSRGLLGVRGSQKVPAKVPAEKLLAQ